MFFGYIALLHISRLRSSNIELKKKELSLVEEDLWRKNGHYSVWFKEMASIWDSVLVINT